MHSSTRVLRFVHGVPWLGISPGHVMGVACDVALNVAVSVRGAVTVAWRPLLTVTVSGSLFHLFGLSLEKK